jgi:hypothetical protein
MEIIKGFRLNSKFTKLQRRFALASISNGRLQNKQTGVFLPPTMKQGLERTINRRSDRNEQPELNQQDSKRPHVASTMVVVVVVVAVVVVVPAPVAVVVTMMIMMPMTTVD